MEIKGICPIAPAVYNDRGEVDVQDYMNCCEKLIGLGAQALTLFGIAGEYYKMEPEEEHQLIAATVKVCHDCGAGVDFELVSYDSLHLLKQFVICDFCAVCHC